MPLVRCKVCGNEVAHDANSCPKCGSPSIKESKDNRARNTRYKRGAIVLIILLFLAAVYVVWFGKGLFPKDELPKGPGASQNRR